MPAFRQALRAWICVTVTLPSSPLESGVYNQPPAALWLRLVSSTADAESVVAQAFRYVLGLSRTRMDDDRALDELLNPARNRYRLETLNVSMHSPMMRALSP